MSTRKYGLGDAMCYQCQGSIWGEPFAFIGGLHFCQRRCLDRFASQPGAVRLLERFGVRLANTRADRAQPIILASLAHHDCTASRCSVVCTFGDW